MNKSPARDDESDFFTAYFIFSPKRKGGLNKKIDK